MYYNNVNINYFVVDEKGVVFGGSTTKEGAEEIKKNQEREYRNYPKAWGNPPVFHIVDAD
jgi:hypothetical protein